jgi:hypothetical protein
MNKYAIEVVLRERDFAVTEEVLSASAPRAWTEVDMAEVLREILGAIDRAKNPESAGTRQIALRGFSWIVEPAEGGVVIAVEIPMGAAVAGPFDADPQQLDALITRTLQRQPTLAGVPTSPTIH